MVKHTVTSNNTQNLQLLITNQLQQYQSLHRQSTDLTDPVNIINVAAVFLTAGDYGTTIRGLEILDKHSVYQNMLIRQKNLVWLWPTSRIYIKEQLNLALMHHLRNW